MTTQPTAHGCTLDELREIIRLNLAGCPRDDIARRVFGNTAGEATRKVCEVLDDPRAQIARFIPTQTGQYGKRRK